MKNSIPTRCQRIALYVASPLYEGLFRSRGRFRLGRVDPLEEGRRLRRVWPNRSTWTPHHTLRDMGVRLFVMEFVRRLAGIDYEMPELGSDDLISSGRLGAQKATEGLGREFFDQISQEGHMIVFHCGTYKFVSRGKQMPYSAAVDLVAELGASHKQPWGREYESITLS
ncbi:hypothetical protein M9H77_16886 [Catharanthus roseus]|uniref:Uncharacterized protein n=1 Tax=Catharanthus roseus TaxID=4058 RepID=A0ACC0B326_CATRO|nr:hypothetical protein M9H77_16886 [Catharanthus roseus]